MNYSASFSDYSPVELNNNILNVIIGIALTTVILIVLFSIYSFKLKKQKPDVPLSGYVFCFQIYIQFINNMIKEVLGKKFEKITPFFIYLFSYILISNVISIFGITNPTSSVSVTLSLGLVTFFGIFVIGFKYQKLSFLKKYTFNISIKDKKIPVMINPMNVASQFAPLISISLRLWGNIFAGTIITSMLLVSTDSAMNNMLTFKFFNIIGVFVLLPIHIYFDLLSGFIQAFVFMLLTMVYWKLESEKK
ncbi:MAG: F0F1 ATP synthase subunit A [Mycoplasmoidaceae bacterium]|nr:MAG: F0F1 ATP synthase subunit A [Mycoplasmoidaceae bacterium]